MPINLLPLLPPSDGPTRWRRLVEAINQLLKALGGFVGGSNANVTNFGAGYIAFGGLDNSLRGDINFELALNLPNPSGIPGPALFLGSGGGSFTGSISGTVLTVTATATGAKLGLGQLIFGAGVSPGTGIVSLGTGTGGIGTYNLNVSQTVASTALAAAQQVWILTDQAYDINTPGNWVLGTAGETQPGSSQPGGKWWTIGGASDLGVGGDNQAQGGTSAQGRAGSAKLSGGNATGSTSSAIAGDGIVESGQVGKVPGKVILSANTPAGSTGSTVIRHQFGSISGTTLMIDEFPDGSWYLYNGGGFGTAGQVLTSQGPGLPVKWA